MARRRNPLVQWLTGMVSIGFGALTARFPLMASRCLGRVLGRLAYYLVPRVRRVGLSNLDLAYGEALTRREKVRILKQAVQNVGIVAAEFTRIPRLTAVYVDKYVTFEGLEHIDRTRGGVVIGGHFGNWEWMASAVASRGFKVAEVVRPLDHAMLDRFVDRTRRAGNVLTVPKAQAGPEIVRLLKEGYLVGLLVDQNPRENAAPVQFFGRETWGTIGPAMAAMRARVPVYQVSMIRKPDGCYAVRFEPEIPMARSGNLRSDIIENTQRCQGAVERLVRDCPGQWLWFHRRWKARPRLEREWAARGGPPRDKTM